MEVYEVHCDGVQEARKVRFDTFPEATSAAERICIQHHVHVRVVRVLGAFSPVAVWISNDVPGYMQVDSQPESGK